MMGLTRGVGGTRAASHSAGESVLFLDKVIRQSSIDDPFKDISIDIDNNKFYNVVRDSDDFSEVPDKKSVKRFGRREFVNNLPLSANQIAWRAYLNAKTLERLKDVKSVVNIRMLPAIYLDIGDIVTFVYANGEILIPIEIIDIRHEAGATHITGQEVI